MKTVINHIAILVESIESILSKKHFPDNIIGPIEDFEETHECYIGDENQMGRLLLMEAKSEGTYRKALEKRGPGLHHIALDVTNLEKYLELINGTGWLLQPSSIEYYNYSKFIYLCRPGNPALIEVQEREKLVDENYYISDVNFPFSSETLHRGLLCDGLHPGSNINVMVNRIDIYKYFSNKVESLKNIDLV